MKTRRHILMLSIALVAMLVALPLAHAFAQASDDNGPLASDPCQSSAPNPINFQVLPASGPAGSSFFIQGKPHDPRTVGPGSDVVFNWRETPNAQGITASVGADGTFVALVSVPKGFAPGPHQLLYEEASPYAQCLAFTVTSSPQGASPIPGLSGLGALVRFLFQLLYAIRSFFLGSS
ncbi:MAG: hypothetical protein ACYDGX_07390 [Thermoleophilia bacterium]